MTIYTIGFSQKSAEEFFTLLSQNSIKKLIDIRFKNKSKSSGFANAKHLPYFLKLHNIKYEYRVELAPSEELFNGYKDESISWEEYVEIFNKLLVERNILSNIPIDEFDNSVLLCSEPTAKQCHRRLLAEYLAKNFDNVKIKHL